jgi:hypothetical protein
MQAANLFKVENSSTAMKSSEKRADNFDDDLQGFPTVSREVHWR